MSLDVSTHQLILQPTRAAGCVLGPLSVCNRYLGRPLLPCRQELHGLSGCQLTNLGPHGLSIHKFEGIWCSSYKEWFQLCKAQFQSYEDLQWFEDILSMLIYLELFQTWALRSRTTSQLTSNLWATKATSETLFTCVISHDLETYDNKGYPPLPKSNDSPSRT